MPDQPEKKPAQQEPLSDVQLRVRAYAAQYGVTLAAAASRLNVLVQPEDPTAQAAAERAGSPPAGPRVPGNDDQAKRPRKK